MKIGIDIDDTIADTYELIMNYAQEYTIDVLKREPIIKHGSCGNHYYTQYLHGWKEGEDFQFLNEYYERIIRNVRPKTLAVKYLRKLQDEGNEIILITARWETDTFDVKETTKTWVKENNIPCNKLIINAENKLIAAKKENIDIFIDDSFKNCQMVSDSGIKTYIMDTGVNRDLEDDKIIRVYSWPHLYMKLKENMN